MKPTHWQASSPETNFLMLDDRCSACDGCDQIRGELAGHEVVGRLMNCGAVGNSPGRSNSRTVTRHHRQRPSFRVGTGQQANDLTHALTCPLTRTHMGNQ